MPILTEGSFDSQRCGLLRFFTETQLIDSLDTEHIGFSFGQTTNHKPEKKKASFRITFISYNQQSHF